MDDRESEEKGLPPIPPGSFPRGVDGTQGLQNWLLKKGQLYRKEFVQKDDRKVRSSGLEFAAHVYRRLQFTLKLRGRILGYGAILVGLEGFSRHPTVETAANK